MESFIRASLGLRSTIIVLAACLSLFAESAFAQAAFQFAVPGFQAPKDPHVNGIRLALAHGKNQSQRGVDLGMFSMNETGNLSGLSLVAGLSKVTGDMSGGVALSGVNWHTGRDSGLNLAFVNMVNHTDGALNLGLLNLANGDTMADLGAFNLSKSSYAQIGVLNMTDEIKTFQFGVLNMAKNGFLPIFPLFNFPVR